MERKPSDRRRLPSQPGRAYRHLTHRLRARRSRGVENAVVVSRRRPEPRGRRRSRRAPRRRRAAGPRTRPPGARHHLLVRGGVYLGVDQSGGWRVARADRAVLVLGPPRSGKTSGVIVPALLAHRDAAVSTSTKPDVLHASIATRSRSGTVWRFDPTGAAPDAGGLELRWSPVFCSRFWDGRC
jgi:hypothetical protein